MKVIVNKYIPFHGFISMMLYGIMFWRKEYEYKMNDKKYFDIVYNHESIHEAQMKDFCKFIPIGGTIFYIVYSKMMGACSNCQMLDLTLKEGIESAIQEEVPEVVEVINVN